MANDRHNGNILVRYSFVGFIQFVAALLVILVISQVLPLGAHAETIDIPFKNNVPNWWDPTLSNPLYNAQLTDSRWNGAYVKDVPISSGTAINESVSFRALYQTEGSQRYLYLSWHATDVPILYDPVIFANKLYVGFQNVDGNGNPVGNFVVLEIKPYNPTGSPSPGDLTASSEYTVRTYSPENPVWTPLQTNTWPWLNDTARVWVANASNEWAVQMRVPTVAADRREGINLGATFRMWYEVKLRHPADPGNPIQYTWPDGIRTDLTTGRPPADTTTWGDVRFVEEPPPATLQPPGDLHIVQ